MAGRIAGRDTQSEAGGEMQAGRGRQTSVMHAGRDRQAGSSRHASRQASSTRQGKAGREANRWAGKQRASLSGRKVVLGRQTEEFIGWQTKQAGTKKVWIQARIARWAGSQRGRETCRGNRGQTRRNKQSNGEILRQASRQRQYARGRLGHARWHAGGRAGRQGGSLSGR